MSRSRTSSSISTLDYSQWQNATDTEAEEQSTVRQLAAREFREHMLITRPEPGRFTVRRWGSGIYAFHVIIEPGLIVVYGDMGDVIVRMNESSREAVIGWLRGAVTSPEYLIGKVRATDRPTKRWFAGDAYAYLAEWVRTRDDPEFMSHGMKALIQELIDEKGVEHERHWADKVWNHVGDADLCSVGQGVSARAWWLVEMMTLFVRLYDQAHDRPVVPITTGGTR